MGAREIMAKERKYSYSKGGFLETLGLFLRDKRFLPLISALAVLLHLVNSLIVKNSLLQVPLGLVCVLIVPGYLWLDVLSPRGLGDGFERLVLSIALSIGIVIISVAFFSLILKIPLTQTTVPLVLSGISGLGLLGRRIFLGKFL